MSIIKLVLLSLLRLTTFGALKDALSLYLWSRPNTPLVGITPPGHGPTDIAASSVEAVAQTSLRRDAFSS